MPGTYLLTVGKAERAVLVQLTDLGITARYDSDQMVVLVTSIATGRPLAGVSVQVLGEGDQPQPAVRTGADGVAVLKAVPSTRTRIRAELLVLAAAGNDRAYLRAQSYGDDGQSLSFNWGRPELPSYGRTMFYPDRDLYRPGETVHIYGIDRRFAGGLIDRDERADRAPRDHLDGGFVAQSSLAKAPRSRRCLGPSPFVPAARASGPGCDQHSDVAGQHVGERAGVSRAGVRGVGQGQPSAIFMARRFTAPSAVAIYSARR